MLLIEAFGGIGGLRKALELIGVLPQGIILIDTDPLCAKLAKRHCAYVMVIDNIKKVTKEMVKQWRVQFARSKRVLLGGGGGLVSITPLSTGLGWAWQPIALPCWTTWSPLESGCKSAAWR